MRILILIIAVHDFGIYDSFKKAQNETWNSINVDNVDTFFIYGDSEINKIEGNNIYTDIKEKLWIDNSPLSCAKKTLKALDILYEAQYDFDFLFRSNLGSYIDKKNLYKHISKITDRHYYDGVVGCENRDIYGNYVGDFLYVNGSTITMSKSTVNLLMEHRDELEDDRFIDDAAIGKLLSKYNIVPKNTGTYFDKNDMSNFHYKLKTNNRFSDIQDMYNIHQKKLN